MKERTKNAGLNIYLLFVVSWFLHFSARLSFLGAMRFDLLLVIILVFLAVSQASDDHGPATQTDKVLRILIAYSVLTIPFVEWPGSVMNTGLLALIKAIVFYYFTIAFVKTEADLKKFIRVFITCQVFRILEPLYLHVTDGYWGSQASMGGWEWLDRLSGAPSDVVNPNGLAFIVCTVLPFLYFMAQLSWKHRLAFIVLAPASVYVLTLTGSRSGMIGLCTVVLGILFKTKNRLSVALFALFAVLVILVGFPFLSPDMQDRYLSIVGKGEKNAETMDERIEGTEQQFLVALHRPIFGHGLGTSPEANANFTTSGPYMGWELPAHNLYLEVAQELGFVGLAIFLLFMKSIYTGFVESQRVQWRQAQGQFLPRLIDAMQVWLVMNTVFSFASYGLTSYEWYLFGGLSVVIRRVARENAVSDTTELPRADRSGGVYARRPTSTGGRLHLGEHSGRDP